MNKVFRVLVTISIGKTVIVIWNYVSEFQHRDLLPLYTEEHHPLQVLQALLYHLDWIGLDWSIRSCIIEREYTISFYYHGWFYQHFGVDQKKKKKGMGQNFCKGSMGDVGP